MGPRPPWFMHVTLSMIRRQSAQSFWLIGSLLCWPIVHRRWSSSAGDTWMSWRSSPMKKRWSKRRINDSAWSCLESAPATCPKKRSGNNWITERVVKEFWQKAASHVLLLRIEWFILLRTPQHKLSILFSGPDHSQKLSFPVGDLNSMGSLGGGVA